MIAVDTNILVNAHRAESVFFRAALACMERLANEAEAWAIPWPCIHEFVSVVTKRGPLRIPSDLHQALEQIDAWMESTNLLLLEETNRHWLVLRETLHAADAHGGRVYDGRIAAICLEHGVTEIWTADRDFSRFAGLATYNPLLDDRVHDVSPRYGVAVRARAAGRRRALAARELRE